MNLLLLLKASAVLLACWLAGEPLLHDSPSREFSTRRVEQQSPLRLRLDIRIDGEPLQARFHQAAAEYVRRLFTQLDVDGDGALSKTEAAHAPPPQLLLPAEVTRGGETAHFAFNFRVLDDNDDGRVTPNELAMYYKDYGDGAWRIHQHSRPGAQGVDLFSQLDKDGDQHLTKSELAALSNPKTLGKTSRQTVRRPVRAAREKKFPLDLEFSPSADSPDVKLEVHFQMGQFPQLAMTPPIGESNVMRVQTANGPVCLQLNALPPRYRSLAEVQAALAQEFHSADSDGNQTVEPGDRWGPLLKKHFPRADGDGDRRLTYAEFKPYINEVLPLEAAVRSSRVTAYITPLENGLLAFLDSNGDGRLSTSEARGAVETAFQEDRNGDGRLSREEIPNSCCLVLARGSFPPPYSGDSSPADLVSDAGPAWFYRQDRNRDGDVSPAEFVGEGTLFRRLDRNRDGLIDLSEAIAVEAQ